MWHVFDSVRTAKIRDQPVRATIHIIQYHYSIDSCDNSSMQLELVGVQCQHSTPCRQTQSNMESKEAVHTVLVIN